MNEEEYNFNKSDQEEHDCLEPRKMGSKEKEKEEIKSQQDKLDFKGMSFNKLLSWWLYRELDSVRLEEQTPEKLESIIAEFMPEKTRYKIVEALEKDYK